VTDAPGPTAGQEHGGPPALADQPPSGHRAALEVQEISLRFGALWALTDVSFDVGEHELFAIIGPNGAGKTSMFNLLSRVYDPTRGRIRCFGTDMSRLRAHHLARAGIARTFQNLGLFPYSSVLDNVLTGRVHLMRSGTVRAGLMLPFARNEERQNRDAAFAAISEVGLARYAYHPAGALPYGLQKRVELARAIAMEPKILLLDEPVAGMSRTERSEIVDLIRALHTARQMAIVLVEHDMGVVMGLAHRVLVLDFGRPIALGTPAQVQADPEVIRAYLGEPAPAKDPGVDAGTAAAQ